MARLLTPTWDGILFAPVDAVERTFVGLEKEEGRIEKTLIYLAMLKPTCFNGKVLELPYIKTLLQNITDDSCFQNFKFRYVERVKSVVKEKKGA